MAKNPELDRLRREIKRKERNAQAKINRIEKVSGINLRGTSYNPRKSDGAAIMRYTAKQLIAYGKRLDAFTDRKTQFEAGAGGTPLPRHRVRELNALQEQFNNKGKTFLREVGGIHIPGAGMTIQERENTFVKGTKRARGAAINKTYGNLDYKAHTINGADSLEKIIKSVKKKLDDKYVPAKIKEDRKQAEKMLHAIGDKEMLDEYKKLTDNQFHILWDETNFASNTGMKYALLTSSSTESEDRWYMSAMEDAHRDSIDQIRWAQSLPKNRNNGRRKKG